MLFDCGEGTQRQMMRFGSGFNVDAIFVTHLHADHYLGIIGLIRTMALQGREDPVAIFGPPGCDSVLQDAVTLGIERVGFPIRIEGRSPGESVSREDYEVVPFEVAHGTPAVGWALVEAPRLGRFRRRPSAGAGRSGGPALRASPPGRGRGGGRSRDHPGDARRRAPVRPLRVYTGDTLPTGSVREAARDADLLIHECTFTAEEGDRARSTYHSTAEQAARLAVDAGAHRLVLTHISARYSMRPRSWNARLDRSSRAPS